MPLSREFFTTFEDPAAVASVPNDRPVILVTGGSLGAERLNDFIVAALPQLLPKYTVLHQAGDALAPTVSQTAAALINDQELLSRYFVFGHVPHEQFAAMQQLASVIVSRAGSTTLFEIALRQKPAIIIPIPEDISRDQRSNAYAYARGGAATVLEQQNLSDDLLVSEINTILENPEVAKQMSQAAKQFATADAATTMADTLQRIGAEHEPN